MESYTTTKDAHKQRKVRIAIDVQRSDLISNSSHNALTALLSRTAYPIPFAKRPGSLFVKRDPIGGRTGCDKW